MATTKVKYRTGFCVNGQCEGTKPRSVTDIPLKTCEFWQICTCDCHVLVTQMFEASGTERVAMQNPEWNPPRWHGVTASLLLAEITERADSSEQRAQRVDLEDLELDQRAPKTLATPSGRRGRGTLEHEVYATINKLLDADMAGTMLTPVLIATYIDEKRPPSTGAVGAVFDRWAQQGFAEIAKKPVRFVAFSTSLSLDEFKAKYNRDKKLAKSKAKRGDRT